VIGCNSYDSKYSFCSIITRCAAGNCKVALNAAGAVPRLIDVMRTATAVQAVAGDHFGPGVDGHRESSGGAAPGAAAGAARPTPRDSAASAATAAGAIVNEVVEALCAMTTCSCPSWEACARPSLLAVIGSSGIPALCDVLQRIVTQVAPPLGLAGHVALLISRAATFQRALWCVSVTVPRHEARVSFMFVFHFCAVAAWAALADTAAPDTGSSQERGLRWRRAVQLSR
jgi:hypothetical protein